MILKDRGVSQAYKEKYLIDDRSGRIYIRLKGSKPNLTNEIHLVDSVNPKEFIPPRQNILPKKPNSTYLYATGKRTTQIIPKLKTQITRRFSNGCSHRVLCLHPFGGADLDNTSP
jgi:hypothetical protein